MFFEPHTTFHRFDRLRRNRLEADDIVDFLLDNNFLCNSADVSRYFFKNLNFMSKDDFIHYLLPATDKALA